MYVDRQGKEEEQRYDTESRGRITASLRGLRLTPRAAPGLGDVRKEFPRPWYGNCYISQTWKRVKK